MAVVYYVLTLKYQTEDELFRTRGRRRRTRNGRSSGRTQLEVCSQSVAFKWLPLLALQCTFVIYGTPIHSKGPGASALYSFHGPPRESINNLFSFERSRPREFIVSFVGWLFSGNQVDKNRLTPPLSEVSHFVLCPAQFFHIFYAPQEQQGWRMEGINGIAMQL